MVRVRLHTKRGEENSLDQVVVVGRIPIPDDIIVLQGSRTGLFTAMVVALYADPEIDGVQARVEGTFEPTPTS